MSFSLFLSRRRGAMRAAGVCLFLVTLLCLPQVPSSQAAPVGGGWTRAAGVHAAEHFVGQYKNSRGLAAYCTDFERLSPENAGGYEDGHSGGFIRSDGSALNPTENAALSYLLHRWGATADNATAASVQLAVWALTSPGMAWDSSGMDAILRAERLPDGVVAEARSMTEVAFSEAGPYEVDIRLEAAGAEGTMTASVSVLGADGTSAAGLAAGAELSGPFALAEERGATWTTADEPHRLTLKRTGLGGGSLTVSVPRTPAAGVQWLLPSRDGVQRLLAAAVVEPRDSAAAIADLPAFQPTVVTRASAARTGVGTTVHDVLTVGTSPVAGGPGGTAPWLSMPGDGTPVSVEVVSTLWGPLPSRPVLQESVPSDTPMVGAVTTRVQGPGRYDTPGLVVPSPGWYVWTESISPESTLPAEASRYVLGWQGKYGISDETTFVPWTPDITTELSTHDSLVGERVTDTVIGSGFGQPSIETGAVVTLSMYGPLPERPSLTADVPADAPLHSKVEVPALNGSQSSESFAAFTAPGCYTVVASYAGDDHTNAFTSAFGEPSETVCVGEDEPAQPPTPDATVAPALPASDEVGQAPARAELAQTGIPAKVASGAALVMLGVGLACLHAGNRSRRTAGKSAHR